MVLRNLSDVTPLILAGSRAAILRNRRPSSVGNPRGGRASLGNLGRRYVDESQLVLLSEGLQETESESKDVRRPKVSSGRRHSESGGRLCRESVIPRATRSRS